MMAADQPDICQARFVLWALRCAVARGQGDSHAEGEIARGFEIADVIETSQSFWRFAATLCSLQWSPTVWHDPRCGCMSTEETIVLRALAEAADELRGAGGQPRQWWGLLLPAGSVERIASAAYGWLYELDRAGVVFPRATELAQSIHPLENLLEPASACVN